jgi:hypothetical protein
VSFGYRFTPALSIATALAMGQGTGERESIRISQRFREASSAVRFSMPAGPNEFYVEGVAGLRDVREGATTSSVWPYVQALRGHFLGLGAGVTRELLSNVAMTAGALLRSSTTDRVAIDGVDHAELSAGKVEVQGQLGIVWHPWRDPRESSAGPGWHPGAEPAPFRELSPIRVQVASSIVSGHAVSINLDTIVVQSRVGETLHQFAIPTRCITRIERSLGNESPATVLTRALAEGMALAASLMVWTHAGNSPDRVAPARVVFPGAFAVGAGVAGLLVVFHDRNVWQEITLASPRPEPLPTDTCSSSIR